MTNKDNLLNVALEAMFRLSAIDNIISDEKFPNDNTGGYDITIVRELLADIVAGLGAGIDAADRGRRAATPQEPPALADAR